MNFFFPNIFLQLFVYRTITPLHNLTLVETRLFFNIPLSTSTVFKLNYFVQNYSPEDLPAIGSAVTVKWTDQVIYDGTFMGTNPRNMYAVSTP